MPSELAHRVDTGGSYPVLEFSGALDADRVRAVLLTALADQPEGLIVDVTGVDTDSDKGGGRDVLADVAGRNAEWPCARVVVCAGQDPGSWRTPGIAVVADRDAALAALGPPASVNRVRQDLEPIVGAARRARELLTSACVGWNLPQVAGHGCIVVTEMVNNVVAHAGTPMTVLLARLGDVVSVAVRDQSTVVPRFTGAAPAPTSYGGRGLLLINSVAVRWGHLPLPGGKVVWAVLREEIEDPETAP